MQRSCFNISCNFGIALKNHETKILITHALIRGADSYFSVIENQDFLMCQNLENVQISLPRIANCFFFFFYCLAEF